MNASDSLSFASMRLHDLLSQALDDALNLLFPPTCVACERTGSLLCDRCAQTVEPMGQTVCQRCGRLQEARTDRCSLCVDSAIDGLTMVRSAARFGHPLRPAIHHLKYADGAAIAPALSRYLVAAFQMAEWHSLAWPVDLVVPVPLHRERMAERGYNQSALLGHHFARRVGLPMAADVVNRRRSTRPQVGLSAAERRENVAEAFSAVSDVAGRSILLIDDVCTTGATLAACAVALRDAGARAVYGLTLAMPIVSPRADRPDILDA